MQQNSLRNTLLVRKISYPRSISRFSALPEVPEPTPTASAKPKIWILNPLFDTLFVCGGLLCLLFVFAVLQPQLTQERSLWAFLLFTAGIIYSDSHNAATMMRFVSEPGLALRHNFISGWLPLLLLFLFVPLAIANVVVLSYAVKLYLILVTQHVSAQAYGITLMYLRKTKIVLDREDILVLKTAFTTMTIAGIVRQLSSSATFESLGITVPQIFVLPDWTFTWSAIVAVTATLIALVTLIKTAKKCDVPLHAGAVMILTGSLIIFTLSGLMGTLALYAPAFFHASQYLAVSAARAIEMRCQARASYSVTRELFSETNFQYCLCVASIGIILYLIIPMTISRFGFSAESCLAAMFCTINFHHFAADAYIWRRVKV